ncbi:hypothetical protein FGO68_gene2275 [Halteria grandinella]|uniref:Uncharacterized protein n=1 Tax=Halteria grandinella TaxID=5974 RepID=A0A8J8T9J2_HALGN|nr:hypothetical protein FGO68_gene2275 [Halteria grandinella]
MMMNKATRVYRPDPNSQTHVPLGPKLWLGPIGHVVHIRYAWYLRLKLSRSAVTVSCSQGLLLRRLSNE